jgi:hypothetical protein
MNHITSLLTALCLTVTAFPQTTIAPVKNWKSETRADRTVFIPAGETDKFLYEVLPVQKSSGSNLEKWIRDKAAGEMLKRGLRLSNGGELTLQQQENYIACGGVVTDGKSQKLMFLCMASEQPSHQIRYGQIISYIANQEYNSTAINHFIALTQQDAVAAKNNNDKHKPVDIKEPSPKVPAPPVVNKPNGKLLTHEEIKGVVMNMETGMGAGGMIILEYRPYLMLKNGKVYKYPEQDPYSINIAALQQSEPQHWGTWKQEGSVMVVTLPEKGKLVTERWDDNWYWAQPAKKGQLLKGSFKSVGGGGNTSMGGGAMIFISENISFNEKGQFTTAKVTGGSNSDFGVDVSTYNHSENAGTYRFNGYSLELRFNNGKISRQFFYFYPDSKDPKDKEPGFGIGGSAYVPVRKK